MRGLAMGARPVRPTSILVIPTHTANFFQSGSVKPDANQGDVVEMKHAFAEPQKALVDSPTIYILRRIGARLPYALSRHIRSITINKNVLIVMG